MPRSPSLKISPSGVRGIVGESLTPQLVASFAAAFGTFCRGGEVIIGTDTRPSRQMVTQAAVAGLLSVGCRPVDIGVVPVPVLQFQLRSGQAAGGICITASHNPIEWNALKFFDAKGLPLRSSQFAELRDLYHQGVFPRVSSDQIAELSRDRGAALSAHQKAVLSSVQVEVIAARRYRVVVDCCNGAASLAGPQFLQALGCQVIALHADPDQPFPRNPEPIRENLGELCRTVRERNADAGFALDADADRLALVDEQGVALGEDATVSLVVRQVLSHDPGPVVVNLSTSRMVDAAADAFGCPVLRAPVGEINVLEEMFRRQAVVGGEGNGGVILPAINPCRDSFVGMAQILQAMAENSSSLSGLRALLPQYAMVKARLKCRPRDVLTSLQLLRRLFRDRAPDLRDGVKVDWPDRWLHVRGSNTEPVLRLVAEAEDAASARELIHRTQDYLRPLLSGGVRP